jgi:hypothetical protein
VDLDLRCGDFFACPDPSRGRLLSDEDGGRVALRLSGQKLVVWKWEDSHAVNTDFVISFEMHVVFWAENVGRNSHLEDLDADVHGVKAWCVEAQHVLPLDVESEVCENCLPAGGWDG